MKRNQQTTVKTVVHNHDAGFNALKAAILEGLNSGVSNKTVTDIVTDWLAEAHRRAHELDEGVVQTIPAEEVRRKAQTLLR